MKRPHVLWFDDRGLLHGQQTLADYLPGLDPGLTPLGPREALLAGSTLTSLELAYGKAGSAAVLHAAGVVRIHPASDAEALQRLLARDAAALPVRLAVGESLDWHLDEINVKAAWARHWGGPERLAWGTVRVGQIDTGYTPHPVFGFGAQPWVDVESAETFFAVGEDRGDAGPGRGIDPLAGLQDGHGTRVGSVICGHDVLAPDGIYYGVAPRVPLVPVRIANCVLITHAQRQLAQALRYLVRDCKVSVINLSMGFLPRLPLRVLKRAIDETYLAGVILVCAAGQPLRHVISPAHGRRTVAAAGSTVGGVPWGQSAYGSAVDWTAPSAHIHRAEMRRDNVPAYAGRGDGTSYAAAMTSGAAALWLALHGGALAAAYAEPWQRVEAFMAVTRASARAMPHQRPGAFGAGILNIAAMLDTPLPDARTLQRQAAV